MDFHRDPRIDQPAHGLLNVQRVAAQAVHRVDSHGVALADKGEHGLELRPLGVFAGGLVDEEAIDGDLIELTLGALLKLTPVSAAPVLESRG